MRPTYSAIPVARLVETRRDWLVWLVWTTSLGSLVAVCYAPVLRGLVIQWWTDPDYSQGFLVPLFAAYVAWCRRSQWQDAEDNPNNFGLIVIIGGIFLLFLGTLGAELFTTRWSLLVVMAGLILFLRGSKKLLVMAFPLGFLLFMIPIPAIIYNQVTLPLQLLASRLASSWLEVIGIPVLRDGNILTMSNYSLEVVEACSGIRSLMALISLSVAYCYFAEQRNWVRFLLALATVPIAIVTNAIRIVIAGMFAHRFGPTFAEGIFHQASGWLIFIAALLLLLGLHELIRLSWKTKPLHA
jgi:exosortase